ncbi:hypothetical protein LTR36_003574 [Oleoguttula mirabilis]|uniref:Uncharacterized protein n=1 Tax=Oleoguttula mirabilis TaxID=1507867 RepID=A0AAV9JJ58_9PEZI|nr:hypothetical protein LTR36_003574 [Oleoguttula mirabilis]
MDMDMDTCAIEPGSSDSIALEQPPAALLLHVPDHSREILHNQRTHDEQQPPSFQLLHRLPTELRLMIFELVVRQATPSLTGDLARVNPNRCRCAWLAESTTGEMVMRRSRSPDQEGAVVARRRGWWVGALALLPVRVAVRGVLWLWGDGRRVFERAFVVPANLSFLRLDKQLACEATSVLYGLKHFWLTSSEALDLSKRPAVVARLRWLTIHERDPTESIFFDVCCEACDRAMRQGMLARLLDGELLQQITIRLEPFYGARIPPDVMGWQGVRYLLNALDKRAFTRWKCTSLGVYELSPLGDPCSVRGRPARQCTCSPAARVLQRGDLLRKVKLEHALLRSLWTETLALPIDTLEHESTAHEQGSYHWRQRWQWRRLLVPFPHRCERAYGAEGLYVCWVMWNVLRFRRGVGSAKFIAKYLDFDETLAGVSVMPGEEERLLGYWTQRMAKDIAKKIWDDPMF